MKRKILVEFEIDWDDYDDVCDELMIEDTFENFDFKDGVSYKLYKSKSIVNNNDCINNKL